MSKWRKTLKRLLFPPLWVVALLTVVSIGCLVCLLVYRQLLPALTYCFYTVWAVWLTLFCCALPRIIGKTKLFLATNKWVQKYKTSEKFRLVVTLTFGTCASALTCIFYLVMGIQQQSTWFFALLCYYFLLVALRALLFSNVLRNNMQNWKNFALCGGILFVTTLCLGLMVYLIVRNNSGFKYGFISTIAVAVLTFATTTVAIMNFVRFDKSANATVLATKAIALATSLVSMLSLTTAMFSAYGTEKDELLRQIATSCMGVAVCVFVLAMGVWMLVVGIRKLKKSHPQ